MQIRKLLARFERRVFSIAAHPGRGAVPINVRDAGEIERAIAAFAGSSNGGLIVTASASLIAI
jgi:hypothetical protein